jgi:hypothetical protein
MTALITSLLAAFWKPLAVAGAAVLAGLGVYLKGRTDQRTANETKDLRDANEIRKQGADARAGADTDRLRDDGWKRD